MSESDESVIPSAMNSYDLLEMAPSSSPDDVPSATKLRVTDAKASVPNPISDLSYDLKINYNESLVQRIGALANTEMLSDVKFLIGEEKAEVVAHTLILALSSPVFTSMFYSPMLERRSVIEIPDCRPDAFQALIQFLYKGGFDKSSRLVSTCDVAFTLTLLYAARKYAVKGLEDLCAVSLSSALSAETVFDILNASNLHSMHVLDAECWEFIELNTDAVLELNLENMDLDVLTLILKNESLNTKEVKLFEFVMRWCENECLERNLVPTTENKWAVGGKLLELVRFPAMTATEFADHVVPTGILAVEQVAKILTYISTSPENKALYTMDFCATEREPKSGFQSFQSKASLAGPPFVTFELGRNENDNVLGEERPRSRRSRRSRRRSSRNAL